MTTTKRPAIKPRRPAAKGKKKAAGKPSGRRWIIVVAVVAAVAIMVGGAAFAMLTYRGEPQWIYIPAGASSADVADSLKTHLGDALGSRVATLWRLQGGSPEKSRGAYLVDNRRNALMLSRAIAKGRQTPVKVSFTGTRTMKSLAERVTSHLEVTPREFMDACHEVLPSRGYKTEAQFAAAFIPDTYEFYWTIDPKTLVEKLTASSNRFWDENRLAQARKLGLTPVEVATIASIVEEETAKPDERPKVARLYINRLKKGMKLQADPTVKYAVGDFSLRRITLEHIKTPSPYNTYQNAGLPPGPIRVVEKSSLIDVLEAPEHDYIYMCAKEDFSGYHNFARDYATHQENARRYQAELNRRNIH